MILILVINKGPTPYCGSIDNDSTEVSLSEILFSFLLGWGRCALLLSWVSLCVHFFHSLIEFYFIMIFIMIVVTVDGICMVVFVSCWTTRLDFLYLTSSCFANAQLPGCFDPCTFSLNIGSNILPSVSYMSCSDSFLRYFTGGGEFQALKLIALAVVGAVD